MWAVGVLAVVAGVGVLVNAHCYIDPSVINKSDRDQQENYLKILEPINGQSAAAWKDDHGNSYDFKVCEDVNPLTFTNVSIMKTLDSKKMVLGYNNRTLVTKDRNWLMLTFLGGQKLENCSKNTSEAHVLFICDHHERQVQIKMLNDSQSTLMCTSTFIVRHRCVCSPSSEGLSGGAIFFILLLVAFLGYFVFGFFYLRLVKGAKGIEQIPNRPFWFRVGNMLADGCGAVFRCDRYCGGASTANSYSGYSPIDERLAQDLRDTDRDSTLLSP
ncbi:cation-dependent mannose-6-phosphate receptor [Procambarus clarkii]|uniref:cation-dependent mannose-6-phosphate receptor n=1 Tax=Procambarus clarkii TaxID=6728 RepID=UPI003744ACED